MPLPELQLDYGNMFVATVPRPVLRDARLRFSIRSVGQCRELTPPRGEAETIDLLVETRRGEPSDWHESAWEHLLAHASEYEAALRPVLWAAAHSSFENARTVSHTQLATLKADTDFSSEANPDLQISLEEVVLYDAGRDEIGFLSFELAVGWDDEHGASVLVHAGTPFAMSGRADFTCRGNPAGHAAYCPLPTRS